MTDGEHYTLFFATENLRPDIIQLLLKSGAELDAKDKSGVTPLMLAAERGNLAVLQLFLDRAADVTTTDALGKTVLMYAASGGNPSVVSQLAERGLDVNATDSNGRTVLMHAATSSRKETEDVLAFLLAHGADVNARDNHGSTALMLLVEKNLYDEPLRLLLDKGANVNARDEVGKSPLMVAAAHQPLDSVKLLIAHGADINAADGNGNTVLKNSEANKLDPDVTPFLRKKNARASDPAAVLVGIWKSESNSIELTAEGKCTISQSAGGYKGTWSYDAKAKRLSLSLLYTDGDGKTVPGAESTQYDVKKLTSSRLNLVNRSEGYPYLTGEHWKASP